VQIRTAQGPAALLPALAREIHALDANVAPSELITMREQVDRTTAAQRVSVTILVGLGAPCWPRSAPGGWSTVSQSSREPALRMQPAPAPGSVGPRAAQGPRADGGRHVLGWSQRCK
jgi:hypothetical protein